MNAPKRRRCSRCGTLGHTVTTCERRELAAARERETFSVEGVDRSAELRRTLEHIAAVLASGRKSLDTPPEGG